MYFIARDSLVGCIEYEKRNKTTQKQSSLIKPKSSSSSLVDPDKEKLFKKFLFKFNQDNFDLLKVIKYSQIIMMDKKLDA